MQNNSEKLDAYFSRPSQWREAVNALRKVLQKTALTEDFKWRGPCYTFESSNVAIIGEYRDFCVLSFLKGILIEAEDELLVAPGDNSRSTRYFKFQSAEDVQSHEADILRLIDKAIANERDGRKVVFEKDDLDYPEELTVILDEDEAFKTAFEALTPGRRRGYLLVFSQPKQSATKTARIEKARARILEGKGLHDH